MALYFTPKNNLYSKTVVIGDNAFTVLTKETGIIEVALWLDKCPTNWNIPMGNVVFKTIWVGITKVANEGFFGANPRGKLKL